MDGLDDAETADVGTQTNQPTCWLAVPSHAKATKIKDEDLIPPDIESFGSRVDGSIRAGDNIRGQHRSATRAKNRAVTGVVNFPTNQGQTPDQTVPTFGETSKHADARSLFKSAGLMDTDELKTLRHTVSQSNKLLQSALATDANQVPTHNKRQQTANAMVLALADAPPTDHLSNDLAKTAVPSKRMRLDFLPAIPFMTAIRRVSRLEHKTTVIRGGVPTKKDWLLISRKKERD